MIGWRNGPARVAILLGLAVVLLAVAPMAAGAAGRVLGREDRAQHSPADLLGRWELVTLQSAGQPAESVAGLGLSLTFEADGRVLGSGGCNGFGGKYTTTADGRLTFSDLAATLIGCAPAVNDREVRYFATLLEVRSYALDGPTTLRLGFDGSGRQLVYQRAMPGMPATGSGGGATHSAVAAPAGITLLLVTVATGAVLFRRTGRRA